MAMIRSALMVAVLTWVVATAALGQSSKFRITTDEAFDPASIAAYAGDHEAVYRYIDANVDDHLANIQRWLRQPSISAQNKGIQEMARMLVGDLQELGFQEAELVPTSGHPGVWGYYDAGTEKTLMLCVLAAAVRDLGAVGFVS